MTQFGLPLVLIVLLGHAAGNANAAAVVSDAAPPTKTTSSSNPGTNTPPDFTEVYELLRSHLTGVSEADLNRAAVEGLLTNLRGKVSLIAADGSAAGKTDDPLVARGVVLEEDVAYLRVARVADGLAGEIQDTHQKLSETNKLKGVVLDLRFADGDDFAAAAAAADLFVARQAPLLDWGDGMAKARDNENEVKLPVALLVNRDTSGAAEALAAVLRETGSGLLLGATTAGGAMIAREYPLKDGRRLRIATVPVKLGDGSPMTAQGVKPDIEVIVSPEDERAYLKDAYAVLPRPGIASGLLVPIDGTNRPARRPRISEADLVRERREGTNLDLENFTAARDREPEKPLIRDPALARAVDLLKGLAVVRRPRS